ncbi:MAG: CsgG/HfaB family protein [Geminicoccaceae bacterium]
MAVGRLGLLAQLLFVAILFTNGTAVGQGSEQPVIAVQSIQYGGLSEHSRRSFDETGLMAALERALSDSRKFRVATRDTDKLKVLRNEQKFSKSDASAGNAANEGELLATNYVVIPTVMDFQFGRKHRDMPNITGKYFRTEYGKLEVQTEVLDTSSGRSVASYLLEDSFSTKETIVNENGGAPAKSQFLDMANAIGQSFADNLISAVFPMKVIGISNGQIYINRGAEGGLAVGDVLDVFRVGEALVDPDTGESLGVIEDHLGDLKIIEVKPKVAIAEPVSLSGEVAKLDIVRKP